MKVTEARIVLFVLLIASVVLGYWAFDRRVPVEVTGRVVVPPTKVGGSIVIASEITRHRVCFTRIERVLLDALRRRFVFEPQESVAMGAAGPDDFRSVMPVPKDAEPGGATVRFAISWQCNPLHVLWPITRVIEMPIYLEP